MPKKVTALRLTGVTTQYKCDECQKGLMPEVGVAPRELYLLSNKTVICTICRKKIQTKAARVRNLEKARASK